MASYTLYPLSQLLSDRVFRALNCFLDCIYRGKSAQENNFPDRRGEYGVDLTQEPSIFALEQQTGYTYPRLRTSGKERLLKGDCEDGYAIADLKHNGSYLGRLFCLTDGHGGRACSSFV